MKKVFVTVGTTKFPKLIDTITQLSTLQAFQETGYDYIQIQTGRDFNGINIDPLVESVVNTDTGTVRLPKYNMTIKYNEYFENFEEEIQKADLVVSHAGAGSCLDVLKQNKPLVVVVNLDLMDNHQTELAEQLQQNGHLYYCVCDTLSETLRKNFRALIPYPKPNSTLFSNYLDKCCGFDP